MSDSPPEPTEPAYCPHTSYDSGEPSADLPATGEDAPDAEREIWEALKRVEDPEMPISVVDLGLIYGVERENASEREVTDREDDRVIVEMTLTYTGCPAREMLLDDVRRAVEQSEGVEQCTIRLVWSPEWSTDFITERGRRQLREFGVSVP